MKNPLLRQQMLILLLPWPKQSGMSFMLCVVSPGHSYCIEPIYGFTACCANLLLSLRFWSVYILQGHPDHCLDYIICMYTCCRAILPICLYRLHIYYIHAAGPLWDTWRCARRGPWASQPQTNLALLLGQMGKVVQVPAPGPHQGLLWRENWNLLRLAGYSRRYSCFS